MGRYLGTIQLVTHRDGTYGWTAPDGRERFFDRNMTLGQMHAHVTSVCFPDTDKEADAGPTS